MDLHRTMVRIGWPSVYYVRYCSPRNGLSNGLSDVRFTVGVTVSHRRTHTLLPSAVEACVSGTLAITLQREHLLSASMRSRTKTGSNFLSVTLSRELSHNQNEFGLFQITYLQSDFCGKPTSRKFEKILVNPSAGYRKTENNATSKISH